MKTEKLEKMIRKYIKNMVNSISPDNKKNLLLRGVDIYDPQFITYTTRVNGIGIGLYVEVNSKHIDFCNAFYISKYPWFQYSDKNQYRLHIPYYRDDFVANSKELEEALKFVVEKINEFIEM